jgi:hypothetical protein
MGGIGDTGLQADDEYSEKSEGCADYLLWLRDPGQRISETSAVCSRHFTYSSVPHKHISLLHKSGFLLKIGLPLSETDFVLV